MCKHCIMTVIVVGCDLLVYFSSSCHQCTHLRLRWVHGYMDDFIFKEVNLWSKIDCINPCLKENLLEY